MTFDARENSVADGKPVGLYLFERGGKRWAYTSADRDIEMTHPVAGETEPVAVTYLAAGAPTDGGVTQSGQATSDMFQVSLSARTDFVASWRGTPPSDSIYLTVRQFHDGDTESRIYFVGEVIGVREKSAAEALVMAQMLGASFVRDGLRLGWERGCPHMLYDRLCKVDKDAFKLVISEVTALTGSSITAPEFDTKDDGWFDGGFVEWDIGDGAFERRPIDSHVGDTIQLLGFTDGLEVGQSISAYPGCRRTVAVCGDKFDNLPNYGGFNLMPGESPFDGQPVF